MSKDGRILNICVVHVDDFLVVLDESRMETEKHFEGLKQQFRCTSWEDADFVICEAHFRQDFVHNQWGESRLDQQEYAQAIESLQCSLSARGDQALTAWQVKMWRNQDLQL